jgi:hypothetical protein
MTSLTYSARLLLLALLACAAAFTAPTAAAEDRTLCVFDPSGANGDIFASMKDYQVAAASWGVTFSLKPYTNEAAAVEDFKSKQCHAMLVTGTRSRPFNKQGSTVEAIGALPNYKLLKSAIKLLSSDKSADMNKQDEYENVGIFPTGAVYLLVRDRDVDTIEELAGKKIATFDFDEASKVMVREAGAAITPADVSTFAGMFNNGSVDAAYAPATAFVPLELAKGIGSKGGVIRYPLAQMTMQLIVRSADFPAAFGQSSRDYAANKAGDMLKAVEKAEKAVPSNHWVDISDADKARYDQLFLDVRVRLRDENKVYDKTILSLMRRVRCKEDEARAECADKRE